MEWNGMEGQLFNSTNLFKQGNVMQGQNYKTTL